MVTALRVFAAIFFIAAGLILVAGFGAGPDVWVAVIPLTLGATLSAVLCAAASNALDALIRIESNTRATWEETQAMHRTIALSAPMDQAAE